MRTRSRPTARPATFDRTPDGSVIVRFPWPERILVAVDILADPDVDWFRLRGDLIDITVANGRAIYRLEHTADGYRSGPVVWSEYR